MRKKFKSNYKSSERDQFTIILEDIRSKFGFLADGVQFLRERMDRMEGKMDNQFAIVEQKFSRLELKMDLGFLELKNDSKMAHNRLENHENRISALESNS